MSFSDKLLFLVMSIALIVTMGFVAMTLQDLNDLWSEILKFQERILNLETLILLHHNKIGCNV
tara:strand:+ start:319 stop:507 length:189 start_codon:yes stop_codon:yes gene_type:complete